MSAWLCSALGFLGGVAGAVWAWRSWLGSDSLFSNMIMAVWLLGAFWCLYTITRAGRVSGFFRPVSRARNGLGDVVPLKGCFIPLWNLYVAHPQARQDVVWDCVDRCMATFSLRGMRYVSGSLLLLGLVGTLYGLSDALRGLSGGINALVGEDSAVFLSQLKQQLQQPLAGMAAAFSASLLGVAGTLTMGFFVWQWERARQALRSQAEQWAWRVFEWRPEGVTWWGGDASQETIESWLAGVESLALTYASAEKNHETLAKSLNVLAVNMERMTMLIQAQYQEHKDWHEEQMLTRQVLEHMQRQMKILTREKFRGDQTIATDA